MAFGLLNRSACTAVAKRLSRALAVLTAGDGPASRSSPSPARSTASRAPDSLRPRRRRRARAALRRAATAPRPRRSRGRRPDRPRRRADGRLPRAAREAARAQALPAPPGRARGDRRQSAACRSASRRVRLRRDATSSSPSSDSCTCSSASSRSRRERTGPARGLLGALPLLLRHLRRSRRPGPRDAIWKALLARRRTSSARSCRRCSCTSSCSFRGRSARAASLPLLYLPAAAYLAARARGSSPRGRPRPRAAFARGVRAVLVRLLRRLRVGGARAAGRAAAPPARGRRSREAGALDRPRRRPSGLAPFLLLSVLPRAFGLESPLLSSRRRRAARPHPARLRLRDPEVAALGRRDLRARGDRHDGAPCCSAA